MSDRSFSRVAVLGAGTLGSQIAWHAAFMGKEVVLYDIHPDALARVEASRARVEKQYARDLGASPQAIAAGWERISFSTELAAAVGGAELVIESVPEVPAIKAALYRELSPLLGAETVLVTNSSSLLPRDFAEASGRPARYCALHFANRIWTANIAEIMGHPGTSSATLEEVTRFAIEIGMVPIPVAKEQNGYVLNTWLIAMASAAVGLVADGVSTPEDVDRTFLIANRGVRVGPFGMADVVGLDTMFHIFDHWGKQGGPRMARNAAFVKPMVEEGRLGMKSGRGFYEYPRPAYFAPEFTAVPDVTAAPVIAARASLDSDE